MHFFCKQQNLLRTEAKIWSKSVVVLKVVIDILDYVKGKLYFSNLIYLLLRYFIEEPIFLGKIVISLILTRCHLAKIVRDIS